MYKKVNRKPEMFSYAKELNVSVNSRVKFLFYVRAKLQESETFCQQKLLFKEPYLHHQELYIFL